MFEASFATSRAVQHPTAPRPKTIQIFLPDGNPRSVRIAEITSRTARAVEVPRAKLDVAATRSEVCQVGLYFLFDEEDEAATSRVYVGESEDCFARLKQHHVKKDFWTRAVVVTSKTRRFDKAQVRWLEWYAVVEAARVGRYAVENLVSPSEPYITEPVKADLLDTLDTVSTLLSTLGFPVFEPVHSSTASALRTVYRCKGRGVEAQGEYVEDGMLVLAGSELAKTVTPSSLGQYPETIRVRLLASGVVKDEGDRYVFTKDHLFKSPSGAAMAVLGRTENGWTKWRDAKGVTLDETERQSKADEAGDAL